MTEGQPRSLAQQADLLMYLLRRCAYADGSVPKETLILIEERDYVDLMHLERRLRWMAVFENEIKKLVTRR